MRVEAEYNTCDMPRLREAAAIAIIGGALAILMTWPLASGLGRLGRTGYGDGQFSIWNISWVARTAVVDPLHVFDANIFHPHRRTLAYSEANLGGGALAVPVYWLTRNPFAAHNAVVLFSFASSFVSAFLLMRYLTNSAAASAPAAMLFAFCPYVFSHTAHIQLLMTGGLPLSMLMLHRAADDPSPRRGAALGLALAAQALSCAYYGIFAGLMVGYGALLLATTRRLWSSRPYWTAIAIGAVTSIVCVAPFFLPYVEMQSETGFARSLADAARWSANPQSYLASSAHAHRWLLALIRPFERWSEVLFPGLMTTTLGIAGLIVGARTRISRTREITLLYGSLAALAFWASFGPAAGLYRILYYMPLFSFLRAPSRFGLAVVLALAVLAAIALERVLRRLPERRRVVCSAALMLAAVIDLNILPFPWERAPAFPAGYAVLAKLPRAGVAEFPFYGGRIAWPLHTQYMLFSTAHWMPLVNGYSDAVPPDWRDTAIVLDSFPSDDSFGVLARHRTRYITIHWDLFGPRADEIRRRLAPFERHLKLVTSDDVMSIYEVVSFP
jgi:hypothetical protein